MRATRNLPAVPRTRSRPHVMQSLGAMWFNPQYRLVLGLIAIQSGLLPLFNRALPFLGEARFGGAGWAGTALTEIALAQALALPAWMATARARSSFAILVLAYAVMMLALVFLATAVSWGSAAGPIGAIGLGCMGAAQAGMNLAIWALLATSFRHDAANEALPVGVFLVVLKTCAGLGQSLLAALIPAGAGACGSGACHGAAPAIVAAIVLPLLGCGAAMTMVLRLNRATTKTL